MEDQITILTRLKEGEISVEEAERLLAHLEDMPPHHRGFGRPPHERRFRRPPMPPVPPAPPHMPFVPPPPFPPKPPHVSWREHKLDFKRKRKFSEGWSIRTSELLSALQAFGINDLEGDELETLRAHHITPEYITELREAGLHQITVEELVELRNHGVKPDYVEVILSQLPGVTIQDIIEMRNHGVRPQAIEAFGEAGFSHLSPADLIEFTNHGVRPRLVKALQEAGYQHLTPDEIIDLSNHGVSPRFIEEMAELGYNNLGVEELIELATHGIKPGFIKKMAQLGFPDLEVHQLVELRNRGLHPRFLEKIRANQGNKPRLVKKLVDQFLQMRQQNMDADIMLQLRSMDIEQFSDSFARKMDSLGYPNLTPQQLIDLWVFDVDPAYVQTMHKSHPGISLNELIDLRKAELT